jgi:hypothetical protein
MSHDEQPLRGAGSTDWINPTVAGAADKAMNLARISHGLSHYPDFSQDVERKPDESLQTG